jgi:diguanylate cyclase (GGDEF)-like protein
VPRVEPADRDDVEEIAAALCERADDVVDRAFVRGRARERGSALDVSVADLIEAEYAKVAHAATVAVATWMGGGDAHDARVAGARAWQLFGHLAAGQDVALGEMSKRCLHWRDAALDVASEEARRLGACPAALVQVGDMLRRSCDVTLVRLSQILSCERERLHGELADREERLRFQVGHDPLTGLATREVVLARGDRALALSRRHPERVAVLLVDVDDFKDVNDVHGHDAGDDLLRSLADGLRAAVPQAAEIGRLGADCFVVLLDDLPAGSTSPPPALSPVLARVADAVLATVRDAARNFRTGTDGACGLAVTASVGVAVGGAGSARAMLRDADIALHHAKQSGKDRCVVFEPVMTGTARSGRSRDLELRAALDAGELFLTYQPTFDLSNMGVTGVEALLRWRHPARGVVMPDQFVPQLERSGAIIDVGRWVLIEACAQGARWHRDGRRVPVSVNVSARQLDEDAFVGEVEGALRESSFPAELLTLEITETAIVEDAERSARRLGEVRSLGVRVAVDDFGTGYSSLAHLQLFPVDRLKIDRSFVAAMLLRREARVLVHTLVQLGQALGIETLAEGIEDLAQLAHLRDESCGGGQGFLLAEPLSAAEVVTFFDRWSGGSDAVEPVSCVGSDRPQ